MVAKSLLRTTKHLFSSNEAEGPAIEQVKRFIGDVLEVGIATEIKIHDDRGNKGTIDVSVTQPRR